MFDPTPEELGKLPQQFQTWSRTLMEERKALKERQASMRLELEDISDKAREYEAKANQLSEKMNKSDEQLRKLLKDLDEANTRAQAAEREVVLERTKLQQLQLDIQDADGNTAALTRKFVEKSSQVDSLKQHCSELEDKITELENKVATLENQLRLYQVFDLI